MKTLIAFGICIFFAAGYLGYRALTSGIQDRIGSLEDAERFRIDLRARLDGEDGCLGLIAGAPDFSKGNRVPIELDIQKLKNAGVTVESAVLTQPLQVEERVYHARLRLKLAAQLKEQSVALLRLELGEDGRVAACRAAPGDSADESCEADNSPDPFRAGGKANIVRAPHGTAALSGPAGQPIFGFKGIVKWLAKDACGPVNLCENGRWTTIARVPCGAR